MFFFATFLYPLLLPIGAGSCPSSFYVFVVAIASIATTTRSGPARITLSAVFWLAFVFACCEVLKQPSLRSYNNLAVVFCDAMIASSYTPESVEQVGHKEAMPHSQ